MLLAIAFSGGCKHLEPKPSPPNLTVVTGNMANAFTLGSIHWQDKADRFAALVVDTGVIPDIISMTESTGWTSCGGDTTGDYDMVDRIMSNLRKGTGVSYRIAYMVGARGSFGIFGTCQYYSGHTLLYNPTRLTNITPADVAARPQVAHDDPLHGFQIRRSLPLCYRSTFLEPLETLIDGPPQTDKCGRPTPSGLAWLLVIRDSGGGDDPIASLARFSVVGVTGSSFDVFTVHPESGDEALGEMPINDFISGLTGPPYRSTNPYYPTFVLGDFNCLIHLCGDCMPPPSVCNGFSDWPSETKKVFFAPEDVLAVALGNNGGPLLPVRSLKMNLGMTLPTLVPCRISKDEPYPDRSFSDHCGLLVRFTE
jgi:hypothetical protein